MPDRCAALVLCFLCVPATAPQQEQLKSAGEFPKPVNTQAAGEHPPSPEEMLQLIELPDGFNVTLFAGEPDVQQPIAFDFDDTGRIWVAENYSYGARGKYDASLRDRVVILQDTDGDGRHDVRKVFWDEGWMLTGLTRGFGGLWILNDGTLSFIPDENGDDIPDGPPVVVLNGWTKTAGHNFVSGLLWGPDGWLYGRHGITETSYPGLIDTPLEERDPMNCGIWRFHPVLRRFEIVCNGTTNPWGLDYNEHGQMFMTNNVIGHLWHVVPGAHYERMFGQDFNPHLYELMKQTADHYHWDTTGKWSESRDGKADTLGGGHSHCGGMIYLGDSYPAQYRGQMFMCNTHGRCVNVDGLVRNGSGYVGLHQPNFLKINSPWFRGVELREGPDGSVYLSDWSDNGECHDHDGVHRTSGRIYRIAFGTPQPVEWNPNAMSDTELAHASVQANEWISRRARRILQERSIGGPGSGVVETLLAFQDAGSSNKDRLRSLWGLAAIQALDAQMVLEFLAVDDEHVQSWAVRLGVERGFLSAPPASPSTPFDQADPGYAEPLIGHCNDTDSQLVLLSIASSLQKMDDRTRRMVSRALIGRLAEFDDRNLSLMTWYGLVNEPSPAGLLYVLSDNNVPPDLLKFVARRIVQLPQQRDVVLQQLLATYGPARSVEAQLAVLTGMQQGLQGQFRPQPPRSWKSAQRRFEDSSNTEVVRLAQELGALFGDGAALKDLRQLIADRDGDHAARSQAVAALAQAGDQESVTLFFSLLNDRAVYNSVVKALASFDHPETPKRLLKQWANLRHGTKPLAIDTLASRRTYARELATAIESGTVSSDELTATQVRQLLSFKDPEITRIIESFWGVINNSSEARSAAIAAWQETFTPQMLGTADRSAGATLFKKSCGSCHKLYGDGGSIGPDLTGSNRNNLEYVLSNVIDPSAVVPKQFTTSIIALTSGRVITGVVIGETDQAIVVQTDKEQLTFAIDEIDERTRTTKSLMPDGLLDPLTETEIRDLIAFVMHRR
jgi:putative membrane-bound dehydrogenase-like protein